MITRKNERVAALEVVCGPGVRQRGSGSASALAALMPIATNAGWPAPSSVRWRVGAPAVDMWREVSAATSGRVAQVRGSAR